MTLGFLGRKLACPHDVKETAYKGLLCSVLEYACLFVIPQLQFSKTSWGRCRMVQQSLRLETLGVWLAFRLEHLQWESLKQRRKQKYMYAFDAMRGSTGYGKYMRS